MRTQPLPLVVLTGFLGSGKTSTLGHWLTHTDMPLKRTAVIINDFGSVNVDAALLSRASLNCAASPADAFAARVSRI